MNPMEQLANSLGREEGRPAPLSPETALEGVAAKAVTMIPAASRAALTLPPVLAGTLTLATSNASGSGGSLTLPPVLAGTLTPEIRSRVEHFYSSIYEIFERWVNRPKSVHTRRSYRDGVLSFVRHREIVWPQEAHALLTISVADVQTYRDVLAAIGAAPKTINHRVSALSSFYKYLALSAVELRLPILVPNPAHSQFIARESSDPREETLSLPAARARQLLSVSAGDSILAHRDRAIVKLYLYTGIRLATGSSLLVEDFRQEGEEATLRLREKGDKRRTIGLHYAAAQAIQEYLQRAEITSGPLFRTAPAFPYRGIGGDGHGTTDHVDHPEGILEQASQRAPGAGIAGRKQGDGMRLHAALAAGHGSHAPARLRRGHHGGQRIARPPPCNDHTNLRQAPARRPRGRLAQDATVKTALMPKLPPQKSHQWCENWRSRYISRRKPFE